MHTTSSSTSPLAASTRSTASPPGCGPPPSPVSDRNCGISAVFQRIGQSASQPHHGICSQRWPGELKGDHCPACPERCSLAYRRKCVWRSQTGPRQKAYQKCRSPCGSSLVSSRCCQSYDKPLARVAGNPSMLFVPHLGAHRKHHLPVLVRISAYEPPCQAVLGCGNA